MPEFRELILKQFSIGRLKVDNLLTVRLPKFLRLKDYWLDFNGVLRSETRRVDVDPRDFRYKTVRKCHLAEKYLNYIPVHLSDSCQFVGIFPNVSRQTCKLISDNNEGYFEYNKSRTPSDFIIKEKLEDMNKVHNSRRVSMSGGYDTNWENLYDMSRAEENVGFSRSEIIRAVRTRWHVDLHLPRIRNLVNDGWLECVKVNKDAFSGITSAIFFGNTRKRAARYTAKIASMLWDHLKHNVAYDGAMYGYGAREKAQKLPNIGCETKVRTRLVLMVEDHVNRICNAVLQPLTRLNGILNSGAIMVGRSIKGGNYRKWLEELGSGNLSSERGEKFIVGASDWKGYDNSVNSEYIKHGVSLLRACFPKSGFIDRIFIYMYSSVCYKNVVVPNGLIFRIKGGIPSGHPITSWLGSLVCWIVLSVIVCKTYDWEQDKINKSFIHIQGDDARFRLVDDGRLMNFDKYVDESGLSTDEKLSLGFSCLESYSDDISAPFLKHVFKLQGGYGWRDSKLYTNIYSNIKSKKINMSERYYSLAQYLSTTPTDINLIEHVRRLMELCSRDIVLNLYYSYSVEQRNDVIMVDRYVDDVIYNAWYSMHVVPHHICDALMSEHWRYNIHDSKYDIIKLHDGYMYYNTHNIYNMAHNIHISI